MAILQAVIDGVHFDITTPSNLVLEADARGNLPTAAPSFNIFVKQGGTVPQKDDEVKIIHQNTGRIFWRGSIATISPVKHGSGFYKIECKGILADLDEKASVNLSDGKKSAAEIISLTIEALTGTIPTLPAGDIGEARTASRFGVAPDYAQNLDGADYAYNVATTIKWCNSSGGTIATKTVQAPPFFRYTGPFDDKKQLTPWDVVYKIYGSTDGAEGVCKWLLGENGIVALDIGASFGGTVHQLTPYPMTTTHAYKSDGVEIKTHKERSVSFNERGLLSILFFGIGMPAHIAWHDVSTAVLSEVSWTSWAEAAHAKAGLTFAGTDATRVDTDVRRGIELTSPVKMIDLPLLPPLDLDFKGDFTFYHRDLTAVLTAAELARSCHHLEITQHYSPSCFTIPETPAMDAYRQMSKASGLAMIENGEVVDLTGKNAPLKGRPFFPSVTANLAETKDEYFIGEMRASFLTPATPLGYNRWGGVDARGGVFDLLPERYGDAPRGLCGPMATNTTATTAQWLQETDAANNSVLADMTSAVAANALFYGADGTPAAAYYPAKPSAQVKAPAVNIAPYRDLNADLGGLWSARAAHNTYTCTVPAYADFPQSGDLVLLHNAYKCQGWMDRQAHAAMVLRTEYRGAAIDYTLLPLAPLADLTAAECPNIALYRRYQYAAPAVTLAPIVDPVKPWPWPQPPRSKKYTLWSGNFRRTSASASYAQSAVVTPAADILAELLVWRDSGRTDNARLLITASDGTTYTAACQTNVIGSYYAQFSAPDGAPDVLQLRVYASAAYTTTYINWSINTAYRPTWPVGAPLAEQVFQMDGTTARLLEGASIILEIDE